VPSRGHDPLPAPAGHTIPDTSQDAVGLLGHLGTLMAGSLPDCCATTQTQSLDTAGI